MFSVLIVDDEDIIRESIAKLVRWERIECRVAAVAANGEEALQWVRDDPVDIVITDVKMPRMNGLELIEALSREFPHIECIILSGHEEFEFAQRAMKFGVTNYLLKPLSETEVEEAVLQCITEKEDRLDIPRYDSSIVNKVVRYLKHHYWRQGITLEWLSESIAFCDRDHLGKLFKKHTGVSLARYLLELRIEKAKEIIKRHPDESVSSYAAKLGFPDDGHYFAGQFKKITGLSPSEYRREQLRTT